MWSTIVGPSELAELSRNLLRFLFIRKQKSVQMFDISVLFKDIMKTTFSRAQETHNLFLIHFLSFY